MCRITGFLAYNKAASESQQIIEAMRDTMVVGGPDDQGFYIDQSANFALGHRRLSVIDLSKTGHQPMQDATGEWVICYNGEVYNYKVIKRELEELGVQFHSSSDTEVVLQAWIHWGKNCLEKFRGMFAFAIYNTRYKQLTLVRDRMGVKPLYWYHHNGLFMFASELKAFHEHPGFKKELCQEAIKEFMTYGVIHAPRTIFKQAFKLTPGSILELNQSNEVKIEQYWQIPNNSDATCSFNEQEFLELLEKEMQESFQLRMVSDVPVGVFLSGGVDSSLLTSILQKQSMNKINTFTIGFDQKKYDESPVAKKIAAYLGTSHHELTCSLSDALNVIPLLPDIYDEPFGDTSAIPTYMVSKLAKQHVKVSLSADGGDEQYAGYHRYKIYDQLCRIKKIPLSRQALRMIHSLGVFNGLGKLNSNWVHFDHRYQKIINCLNQKNINAMIPIMASPFQLNDYLYGMPCINGKRSFQKMKDEYLFWDMQYYLPDDILTKVDRATMAVSLEGREPLLDHKLIELSLTCPYQLKIKNGYQKYPMRKILSKYIPAELTNQPKKGFGIPLFEWLFDELYDTVSNTLESADFKQIKCFDPSMLSNLVSEFRVNKHSEHPLKIWYLFTFFSWYNRWMK